MQRLVRGIAIRADGGWRGKVERQIGNTVVCIAEGYRPNDHLNGYRTFARADVVLKDGAAMAGGAGTTQRKDENLLRALQRSWDRAPTWH